MPQRACWLKGKRPWKVPIALAESAQRFAACDAARLTNSVCRQTFRLLSQWRRYQDLAFSGDQWWSSPAGG